MIGEMRRVRLELDNQRHFTEEKQPIELTRAYIERWTEPRPAEDLDVLASRSAVNMNLAARSGLIEMG